jgi:hypothetical protein
VNRVSRGAPIARAPSRERAGTSAAVAALMTRAIPLLAVAALTTGCLSHLAPRSDEHLAIHWEPGFDAARAHAEREGKPLLVVMVAGEIAGKC